MVRRPSQRATSGRSDDAGVSTALAWPPTASARPCSALRAGDRRIGPAPDGRAPLFRPPPGRALRAEASDRGSKPRRGSWGSRPSRSRSPMREAGGLVRACRLRRSSACRDDRGEPRFLVVVRRPGREGPSLLAPDASAARACRSRRSPMPSAAKLDARLGPEVDGLLDEAGVARAPAGAGAPGRPRRAGWPRPGSPAAGSSASPPGASFWKRRAGPACRGRRGGPGGRARRCSTPCSCIAWWVLGRGVAARAGSTAGWLLGLGAARSPPSSPSARSRRGCAGVLSDARGQPAQERLLAGALRIEPEEIRHQGAGQLLGRVLELRSGRDPRPQRRPRRPRSPSSRSPSPSPSWPRARRGWPHVLLLLAWLAVGCLLAWRYFRRRRALDRGAAWTMTHDLVEQMAGHRTRLAQQRPGAGTSGRTGSSKATLGAFAAMDDRAGAAARSVVPRGWLLRERGAARPGVRLRPLVAGGPRRRPRRRALRLLVVLEDGARPRMTWRRPRSPGSRPRRSSAPPAAAKPGAPEAVLDAGARPRARKVRRSSSRRTTWSSAMPGAPIPCSRGCGLTVRARRPGAARRPLRRRQVDPRLAGRRAAHRRTRACSCCRGSTASPSGPKAGAAGWWRRRSSRRTTS